ncbi:iron ABC transporter [Amycolatopsis antarctica]|uniref:Iron ABC transporter n=2 Tax=Amycolatopsis antarctica TaxID=1854586 RepID=A0A263D1J5_9PSEU|nr:iron ABC transporter [Amycolatopsis antarctica]
MFAVALSIGEETISLPDVLSTLAGQGSRNTNYIILESRLPRALTGLMVGAAFGLSGAIFQTLLRNPLASPDIIGISMGASASAIVCIVAFGLGGLAVSAGALGGALLTAALMYLLAWRRGISGYRIVLVGIGLAAMLSSVVSYMLTRSQVTDAAEALIWLTGSLNGRNWSQAVPLAICLLVLVPSAFLLSRTLGVLRFGDDTARGLGARVETGTIGLLLCAVSLAGIATAATGPVAFVALLAAPIARRLVRDGGAALLPSALVGALILGVADFAAQNLPGVGQFPVGVLTGSVGAPYLLWLLARANRGGRGG